MALALTVRNDSKIFIKLPDGRNVMLQARRVGSERVRVYITAPKDVSILRDDAVVTRMKPYTPPTKGR